MPHQLDLRLWLLTQLQDVIWLDEYYRLALLAASVLFLCSALAPLVVCEGTGLWRRAVRSDALFLLCLVVLIVAGRWPGLLPSELNPDESMWLAGAQKLLADPVFWRSVDSGTSGPLNVYPLTWAALCGLRLEYASARILGLLLVLISCGSLYFALQRLYDKSVARLALVPIATTLALMTARDYVHYSSEHVSLAFLSVALYLVCRLATSAPSAGKSLLVAIGLLLGAIPYAKLQAIPLAAALAGICLHVLWSRSSTLKQALPGVLALGCGLASGSIAVLAFVIANSLEESFFRVYLLQNLYFSNFNANLAAKVANFVEITLWENDTRPLFFLTAGILLAGVPALLVLRRNAQPADASGSVEQKPPAPDTFVWLYYSLAWLAAAVFAVAQPQRRFFHYALFLIVPSGLVLGVVLGELRKLTPSNPARAKLAANLARGIAAALIALGLWQLGSSLRQEHRFIAGRRRYLDDYISPVAQAILSHASPGESMAIWGWSPGLYVETGLLQATSETVPVWQFRPNPRQAYFVKRFADELRGSKAKLFVDTQNFGDLSHEWLGVWNKRFSEHPEIAEIVERDFTIVEQVNGVTIYARK